MDPFAIVLLGGIAALILWVWVLGRFYPGSGLEQLGLKSARQITETREALEADDLEQMLEAHNARRRARGEPERTVAHFEARVFEDLGDQRRRARELQAERERERGAQDAADELDQLLEATNARRRARGLPERTRADVEREFGPPAGHDE